MIIKDLNSLLQEVIKEVNNAGIVTGNINPEIELHGKTKAFGTCKKLNDKYKIYLSKYFINNPKDEIKHTLVHEVLHTIQGCMNHGEKWKYYANMMNNKYGYNIKRTSSHVMNNEIHKDITRQYTIKCTGCGTTIYRQRLSKLVTNTDRYRCGKCKSKLILQE